MQSGRWRFLSIALLLWGLLKATAQPTLSVVDTQVAEGDSGTTNVLFVISLSAPYTNTLVMNFTTFEVPYDFLNEPYPAKSGIDFVATNGWIIFEPGQTNKTISVQVIGDTINEANERFGLGVVVQGNNWAAHGYCTILDDDPLEILLNATSALEGPDKQGGLLPCTITTLATTEQVVYGVTYVSSGTAVSGYDFYGGSPLRWTLYPGPPGTSTVGYVPLIGDDVNEDDESVILTAGLGTGRYDTNPQNARGVVFLNQNVQCTILNDDFYLAAQRFTNNLTRLTLYGASNVTHVLQSSTDLVNWTSFSTNTLDATQQVSVLRTNSGQQFFRALRSVNASL